MATITLRVCDRCGLVADDEGLPEGWGFLSFTSKPSADKTVCNSLVLCDECDLEVRDFLKGDCGCGKGQGCPDRG